MNCPQCQSTNAPEAVRCSRCDTPLGFEGATITDTPGAETLDPGTMKVPEGWSVPAPVAPSIAGSLADLQPGTLLGNRYEILQLLGQGGMGAVYRARDREVDRMVALKVIRPELAGRPEILQRFKQELILARQVTHRNVIRIYDLGEADGIKFITMQFIEGQDLKSLLIQKGKCTVEEAVGIIQQVCLALEAAHAEGVVHRDLKPQNIMLDKQGKVTVMDFGIARSVEFGGMTQTGALMGTPEYMSPEQVRGEEVDARSDLFTLGIIFCELLTGKMPYQADTVMGTMFKRTKEPATPPAQLDPSVPRAVSEVVTRCLEMDSKHRYQSAAELRHELETWQGPGMVFPAARGGLAAPALRWLRRAPASQKWLAAGLGVFLLALTGFVFRQKLPFRLSVNPGATVQPVSLAVLPFRNASGDPAMDWLGPSLAEMLRTDVGQSAGLRTVPADRVHQILKDLRIPANAEFDPGTLQRLAEFSNAQTLVWGQFLKIGDQIRIDATLQDLKRQRTIPVKVEAPSEKELLRAVEQLAQTIQQNLALSPDVLKELRAKSSRPSSNSVQALRSYNEGLLLARQGNNLEAAKRFEAATQADPEFALAFSRLGQTYANLGYDDKAEQFSRKAVELSEKLPPQEQYLILANHARIVNDNKKAIESYQNLVKVSPDDIAVRFELARLYEDTGSFDLARDNYAQVLRQDPKYLEALLAMGRVEVMHGNPRGALDYLNRALSLAVELENDQEKSRILHAIGISYSVLNKPDEALRYYQESLAIRRRLGLKSGIAASLVQIAQIDRILAKPDAALASYKEALQLLREIGDKKNIGATLINFGTFYKDRGEYDQALELYKEALQIEREIGNQSSEALCLNNIGTSYLEKGQYDDALIYFQQALQLREKSKIPGDIAQTLHNLAEANTNMGQYEQALAQYFRALELLRGVGNKRRAAIESYSMGTLFEYQGRYGAAVNAKEEALKTFRELQDRSFWMAEILGGYGNALALIGRGDEAQKSLEEGLRLARELKNQTLVAQTLNFQGNSFFYRGDFKSAKPLYQQALQVASGTTDRRLILVSKLNLAKVGVKEGHSQAAISALKGLAQQADPLGLKYLSAECSIYLGEALLDIKDYSRARQELEAALRHSQKLGLRTLLARSHHLLAMVLHRMGNRADASRHYADARRILEEIHKEAQTDALVKRADLNPILSESSR